jgi:hypothetical protein
MTGYAGPIESHTLKNTYFRQVLFTGKHAQLVVMCLSDGGSSGRGPSWALRLALRPWSHSIT